MLHMRKQSVAGLLFSRPSLQRRLVKEEAKRDKEHFVPLAIFTTVKNVFFSFPTDAHHYRGENDVLGEALNIL